MMLVTGGAGFIGSNFVHEYIRKNDMPVLVLDKLTYAASLKNLLVEPYKSNIIFIEGDIGDSEKVIDLLLGYHIDRVVNFAAESHVDRSITNADPFIQSNIVGTENLLSVCKVHHDFNKKFRFLHVSTDEVYGELMNGEEPWDEDAPYKPRSLYAASKAASDHIAMAYYHTHKLPVIITNCSNNYGPHQHTEKFIPTIITKALRNEKIPVYGTGVNIRDWIYVRDHCNALLKILEEGEVGEKYNIGGDCQMKNIDLVKHILHMMGKPESLIEFVEDRKGHDYRYALSSRKLLNKFGWLAKTNLGDGLKETIKWYSK